MKSPSILSFTIDELSDILMGASFEAYRARQIYKFLYQKDVSQFIEMTNIPKKLINYLENDYIISPLNELDHKISEKRDAHKYLFQLPDGLTIETVLINERARNTICLSSQVGCPLNCQFCATGKMGIKRNLSAGEIVAQFLYVKEKHGSIDNAVFMGMGEPFLNYDNVIKAVTILNAKEGLNFGQRRITISTAGIAKGIRRLAHENLNIHLAVSLNSPFQNIRSEIMPFTKKMVLKQLLDAIKYYQKETNRRITFEYVLLKDVNMSKKEAKQLINLSEDIHFNLNLIPYNHIPEGDYESPTTEDIYHFTQYFKYSQLEVVQRKRKGKDISAACGQLATLSTTK